MRKGRKEIKERIEKKEKREKREKRSPHNVLKMILAKMLKTIDILAEMLKI